MFAQTNKLELPKYNGFVFASFRQENPWEFPDIITAGPGLPRSYSDSMELQSLCSEIPWELLDRMKQI